MRVKLLVGMMLFSLCTAGFAVNKHLHPKAENAQDPGASKTMMYPGYCEIEIVNDSYSDVHVFGTFDDNTTVDFNIYRFEYPHYISLFYYHYCHEGMNITIQTPFYTVYSAWVPVHSTIRVFSYFNKQMKATLSPRA